MDTIQYRNKRYHHRNTGIYSRRYGRDTHAYQMDLMESAGQIMHLYRFHSKDDPQKSSMRTLWESENIRRKFEDQRLNTAFIHINGKFSGGKYMYTPYVSLTTDPWKAASTSDPSLRNIISNAPLLSHFAVPRRMIVETDDIQKAQENDPSYTNLLSAKQSFAYRVSKAEGEALYCELLPIDVVTNWANLQDFCLSTEPNPFLAGRNPFQAEIDPTTDKPPSFLGFIEYVDTHSFQSRSQINQLRLQNLGRGNRSMSI